MTKQLSPEITRVTPAQVLASISRAWRVLFGSAATPESILVLLAQWSLETDDGAAMHAFNLGNIKAREGDGHDFCNFACWEMINGQKVWYRPDHPATRFRAFASLDEGAIDYLQTLAHRFASAWPAVLAGDPEAFAHALKAAHYYTADERAYAVGLRARLVRLRRLVPLPPPDPALATEEPIVDPHNQPVFSAPPPDSPKPKIG